MQTELHTKIKDVQAPVSAIDYEHAVGESFKSKFLKFGARILGAKSMSDILSKLKSGQDAKIEQPEPPKSITKKFDVTSWQVEGRNVYQISPKKANANKHILFLHGGAYILNNTSFSWTFIEAFTEQTNCTTIVPDYPLAPTHTYLDSYKFIDPIYQKLVSEVGASNIILMGGSAGGGLALGLAQKLRNEGLPQPAHIILIAPWLDITCSNPEMNEIDKDDVVLSIDALKLAAESYTRGGDMTNYLVSPMNGSVKDLARISVFAGTHDIFWPDLKKFKLLCAKEGVDIDYYVYPKMMHGWVNFNMAEREHAVGQIKAIIDSQCMQCDYILKRVWI